MLQAKPSQLFLVCSKNVIAFHQLMVANRRNLATTKFRQGILVCSQRRGDFLQERSQVGKIDRLGQMEIEPSFTASPNIFLGSKSTERDTFQYLSPFCLAHQLVAAAVRKANIANQRVELPSLEKFQGALRRIRGSDFVPALGQESGQHMSRVRVVVDEKKAQPLRNNGVPINRSGGDYGGFTQDLKENSKRRAAVFALALHADFAAMQIEQRFRNRQTQAQAAELPGDGAFPLLERLKDLALPFRLDADSSVIDFNDKLFFFIN